MEEHLKEYQAELKDLINKGGESFEKQLNYISAGALGLSIAFIEKVVPSLSTSVHKPIVVSSWVLFTTALISNLLSHLIANNIHIKTIDEINDGKLLYDKWLARSKFVSNWNFYTLGFLLIGLILQILFISLNI